MNRKLLAVVVSGALAVPMAAQAVDFSVSGHIARAIVISDNDGDTNVSHEDAGASGSRFRMTGSSELDSGISAGVQLEYAAGGGTGDTPVVRHSNLYFSGDFGKVTLGQQAPATNGTPYVSYDNHAFLGGVELSCDYCSADFAKSHTVGRDQGIGYGSPNLGPMSINVWSDADDNWDAQAQIAGDAGLGGYKLRASYADVGTERIIIAGAVGLANGGHANVAYGKTNEDDSNYVNVGVGYNVGTSSVAANYYSSDISGGGSAISFGVGHDMGVGVEVFASYMYLSYDDEENTTDDGVLEVDNEGLFVVGARVKFN